MHPPLKIIDQTDELIAIEWLNEHGYNSYADHMEQFTMDLIWFRNKLGRLKSWTSSVTGGRLKSWTSSVTGGRSLSRTSCRYGPQFRSKSMCRTRTANGSRCRSTLSFHGCI